MSHTVRRCLRVLGSPVVAATLVPSGLTVNERKFLSGSGIFLRTWAVATSQIRSQSSFGHPVTSHVPLGPKAQPNTKTEGWGKVAQGSPVAASHKRTVPSQLPEASQRPSGL